ncbi:MAG: uroporphyrinogen-III synthase [Bradyrhizobiaceae bacterium]|nr:uroporphyrinogen-III synthase [Bradyrhizobiaceae bacterium]
MRLLVTRPEPDGARTAALLRARGHEVMQQALLRIEPVADVGLGSPPWAAVLFTSAQAVRAVASHRRFGELAGLPAYTVGQRTRAAAVAAGFGTVISADGDVNALAALIATDFRRREATAAAGATTNPAPAALDLPLLYCAGEDRTGDLAAALRSHGLVVETVCVYRAAIVTDLAPDVRAALAAEAIDAVLHYSARTAAAFVAAATGAGIRDLSIRARHLCLSDRVAAPLVVAGASAIDVASEPNEQALFALIASSSVSPEASRPYR